MILQFNLLYSERAQQYGHKLFYHWNHAGVPRQSPTDEQVLDILRDRYMSEFTKIETTNRRTFFIESYRQLHSQVFLIINSYDADGRISEDHPEFRWLEWDEDGWFDCFPTRLLP